MRFFLTFFLEHGLIGVVTVGGETFYLHARAVLSPHPL